MSKAALAKSFKLAVCQVKATPVKAKNLEYINSSFEKAIEQKPDMIALGEIFNTIYNKDYMHRDAENFKAYPEKSPTFQFMKTTAKKHGLYIVGGSIPEITDDGSFYNTSLVFGPSGEIINEYRKLHLFDINIPGKIKVLESETFRPGKKISTFQTKFGTMGLAICYDLRFPELSAILTARGSKVIFYPGQFNLTTGPLHWEILNRVRAVDNQVWVVAPSVSRFTEDQLLYQSWGHSMIVDPSGNVVASAKEKEENIYADIDLEKVNEVRTRLPYDLHRRKDLYETVELEAVSQK